MAVSIGAEEELTVTPKSAHVSDPGLQPFIQPTFDPAEYLNRRLPSLSTGSNASRQSESTSMPLSELSAQTQSMMSQLNAQMTRLSNILTQMTDDILRSGGRLAYQVEVLRGETIGMSEALSGDLRQDIFKFAPKSIEEPSSEASDAEGDQRNGVNDTDSKANPTVPPYLSQLRTLALVRSRLEKVIQIFGEAMSWTLPPSEVANDSMFSLASPDTSNEEKSREEKGQEFSKKLRNEIADLVAGDTGDGEGFAAATARVQALRDLATIWKGTAEEKARVKFVEGLVKIAEEKHNARSDGARPGRTGTPSQNAGQTASTAGGGFLDNLQRLRQNIYLD